MDASLGHLISWAEQTKGDVPPPLTVILSLPPKCRAHIAGPVNHTLAYRINHLPLRWQARSFSPSRR